jgi:predicted PurR-regulated permease PerM
MSSPVQPSSVPPVKAPRTSSLTEVVVVVVIVLALYFGREVLIPVTLAMLLSFLLAPLVDLLRRVWLGRVVSVLLAVILALGIILALGTAIGTQVAQLGKQAPQYETTVVRKINRLRNDTVNRFSGRLQSLGHQLERGGRQANSVRPLSSAGPEAQRQPVPVVVTQPDRSALQIGETVLAPMLSPLATAGIILVVTIFTLLQKEDLRDRAIRLFGSGDLQRTTRAMDDGGKRLSRYFLTQLGINTSFGVIVAVGLYFIGVPNPVLWGIVGTLLRFVPYVGSWIAALLPMALAAAVAPGWSMVVWTFLLYAVTELTIGQLVEPLVYGHSTGLSPIAVIIAAIFWTWMWGAVGLIISTPLTLCLVVLGRHAEGFEVLDVLFGDRPALTPVEGFYQRILADDPDEAEAQAELYLKSGSLSSYYDEVALKGLQLAANDVARNTLSAVRIERLNAAVRELVDDLDGYDDIAPNASKADERGVGSTAIDQRASPKQLPPGGGLPGNRVDSSRLAPQWQGEAPVLCIAGRGLLDETAASMLAQLLGKHGLGTRVVPYEAVSRMRIGSLDTRGVAMACISYLDIGGNPAHLRYLLMRLRKRLPREPLLVGLWPKQDPILWERDLRRELGADYYVSTLHEAVEACLAAANGADASKLETLRG